MANMKLRLVLNSGALIPQLGLGTWLSKPGEVGAAVEAALKAGYRHIDCAHEYCNEAEIGDAIQKCFKEGVVKREDIFVTSKLWNSEHDYSSVLPACMLTLKNLKLDYLDLYLIHWPMASKKINSEGDEEQLGYDANREANCWRGMEEVQEKGLTRAIGVSNYSITKIEELLKTAKIIPTVNQVECHPYFQQQKLKEYCSSKGILLEAYSPLGNPGNPDLKSSDPRVLDDCVIKEIAQRHKASPAQICIAFAIQRGLVVIPKSVTLARIVENFQASSHVTLDDEDMKRLYEIGNTTSLRYLKADWCMKLEWGDEDEYCWDMTSDKNVKL